ncbi:metallophosphoesterase [Streptomyces malaysiensis]|uniref:metallophosphoesterase n=1 Tax=Streptomyces malaysiensis TaxID=92644 RepID=UPI00384AADC8
MEAQSEAVGAAAGGDEVDGDSVGLDVGGRHGGGGEVWRPALSPRGELPARGLNVPSAQHQHRPASGPSAAKEVSKSWSGRIHGCFDELLELLDEVDIQPDDLLVSVGDLVDRGPAPVARRGVNESSRH